MEQVTDNQQKHENYREQFKRLNSAMKNKYYLEAVFIEYSIMEDRTESVLKHMGKWEAFIKKRDEKQVSLNAKVKHIQHFAREKKTLANRYFGDELLDSILNWKEERNTLIHALLKQSLTTDGLEGFAEEGKSLAGKLRDRSTSFRRAVQKQQKDR